MAGLTPVDDAQAHEYQEELRHGYAKVRYAAVPIFALVIWAMYRRRQRFYANHVVLAVHFYAFWYLVSLATSQLPFRIGAPLGTTLSAVYLVLALRRLFGQTVWLTLAKSAALLVVMIAVEGGLAFASALWVTREWK
jgi:hypothetical protein